MIDNKINNKSINNTRKYGNNNRGERGMGDNTNKTLKLIKMLQTLPTVKL